MRTQRLVAATGAIYVVLTMVGSTLATGNGDPQDGPAILAHLRQGRSPAELAGVAMQVLAFAVFVAFLGYLYRVLRGAEGRDGWAAAAALGAGLVAVAVKIATSSPGAAARLHPGQLTPDLARTLNDLGSAGFIIGGFTWGIFVLAAAGSAFASRALPRWLSISGLVIGALTVAAGVAGVLDPVGYVPVPFLLGLAWVLITSIVLTAQVGRQARTVSDDATAVPTGV
jgi:hypothetical protein